MGISTLPMRGNDDSWTLTPGGIPAHKAASIVLDSDGVSPQTLVGGGPGIVDGAYYGIVSSDSLDHTQRLIDAFTDSQANGTILRLSAGTFYYSGLISNAWRGIIGAGGGLTKLLCTTSNGDNARIAFSAQEDVYIYGVEFGSTNATITVNNAPESACHLRLTGVKNFRIEDNSWDRCYGTAIILRDCEDGLVLSNYAKNLGKDGFHITGASKNILRAFNTIVNAGDDPFPIVGYISDGARPEGIGDIGNRVLGARFGRGFAYVGAKNVRNIGCSVRPLPTSRTDLISATYAGVPCGIYIASESGFDTYGNEDIKFEKFCVEQGGSVNGQNSIMVVGRAGQVTRDIDIEATVKDCAQSAVRVFGSAIGDIENFKFRGEILDTTDPFGLRTTAGTGVSRAMDLQHIRGFDVQYLARKIGGSPLRITAPCTGRGIVDLTVDECCVNTVDDIINYSGTLTLNKHKVTLKLISVGHSIDRIMDGVPDGTELDFDHDNDISTATFIGLQALPAIVGTGSPFQLDNPYGFPVMVQVTGGTVSLIERATTTDVSVPVWQTFVNPSDGVTNLQKGWFTLQPGQSLRVTYSSLPTFNIRAKFK